MFLTFSFFITFSLTSLFLESFPLSLSTTTWLFFNSTLFFTPSSILFFSVLVLVFLSVLSFTSFYLSSEPKLNFFLFILTLFVLSMVFLIFSNTPIIIIISWDILGVSSYFLVLFYSNWDSNVGSISVALSNRVGDFFLFFFFSFFFCSCFLFNTYLFLFFWGFTSVYVAGFTNSAQFPFSSWLPKAISAPTPVSSLVHSSTLVTAGLVLFFCFSPVLFKYELSLLMVLSGLFTMSFSSTLATLEGDINNVVALSTLSQMGFSCVSLGLCLEFFCIFHLISHALFKSCLFIQVGFLLYNSFGSQDGRSFSFNFSSPNFLQFQLLLTLFCLCGMFFTSGLVSNDFILEFFSSLGFPFWFFFLFFFSVLLTFFYSFRLWSSLFIQGSLPVSFNNSSSLNYLTSFALFFLSLSFSWFSSNNLLFFPVFFSSFGHILPLLFLSLFLLFTFFLLTSRFFLFYSGFLSDYLFSSISFIQNNPYPLEGVQSNTIGLVFKLFLSVGSSSGFFFSKTNFSILFPVLLLSFFLF